jgi:hypothetical protein
MILFVRSIMWDLGIPQQAATILWRQRCCDGHGHGQCPKAHLAHQAYGHSLLCSLRLGWEWSYSIRAYSHFNQWIWSANKNIGKNSLLSSCWLQMDTFLLCIHHAINKQQANSPSCPLLVLLILQLTICALARTCSSCCKMFRGRQSWVHIVPRTIMTVQSISEFIPQFIVGGC